MGDDDLKKIGEVMEQALEPVYEEFDKVHKELDQVNNKVYSLTVKMHEFKQKFGVFKDYTHSEIDKIKSHIGIPVTES